MNPQYSLIIPAYNEEAVIEETYFRLTRVMQSLGESYELIFVNDGSWDQTEAILGDLERSDSHVRLLSFSRNFGHQTAVTAGLDHASGRAIIIIDADLQDPPELIKQMIEKWKEGYEVVYGQRRERRGETWFKKSSAALFYRFLNALTDVNIPLDTGDFRLIDRRVADILLTLREKNRFIRGLVSWVGFRQTAIEYVRDERLAGETKYSLKKMLRLSMDGITSFSLKPLQLATWSGLFIAGLSLLFLVISAVRLIWSPGTTTLWSFLTALSLLVNGITLICIGILGEYVGRIYDEARNRPLYILKSEAKKYQLRTERVKRSVR
ncbi:MAG: glycosyltransferase family 2 protein [Syntrophomonadaceae bacterium]